MSFLSKRSQNFQDQVGLGWRSELSFSIQTNTEKIDFVEVIVDDYFSASRKKLETLKTLDAQIQVLYHGVGLGLASAHAVDEKRLSRLAKTLDRLDATAWSEHLAFVRAGGFEIGHLAAPPRTEATIEGTLKNFERVVSIVGIKPALENIATLIDPPGSTMSEVQWLSRIYSEARAPMLLDLHNIYANAYNFGYDAREALEQLPLDRVEMIHLSGGHMIYEPRAYAKYPEAKRLLDDHVHDVPRGVFQLLEFVASRVQQPLKVIIERDGEYPEFATLLDQVEQARAALRRGRMMREHEKGKVVSRELLL